MLLEPSYGKNRTNLLAYPIEDTKKNQMEMLEWKNTVIKTKNLLDRLNGILTQNRGKNMNLKIE